MLNIMPISNEIMPHAQFEFIYNFIIFNDYSSIASLQAVALWFKLICYAALLLYLTFYCPIL